MKMTEWQPENTTKVPVQLLYARGGGFLYFNLLFQGLEVLAAHLQKSDEWFYGLYHGSRYAGYLHFGGIPAAEHARIVEDLFPADWNDLQKYVNRFSDKINYHESSPQSFRYIGELDGRQVMEMRKINIKNKKINP